MSNQSLCADDIHQEVFIRYIRKKPKFENTEHEKSWFLRVTVNLCKNLWKTAWRQKVTGLGENTNENAAFLQEQEPESDEIIEIV